LESTGTLLFFSAWYLEQQSDLHNSAETFVQN